MRILDTVCTIMGMRAYAFPRNMTKAYVKRLLHILEHELRKDIQNGYYIFQTGMDMGADIWCAGLICTLREEFPNIRLHCFLPCETQANHWTELWREWYFDVLARADEVYCLERYYSRGCTERRNIEMLARSGKLILLYDRAPSGGMRRAQDYAARRKLETASLSPARRKDGTADGDAPDYRSAQISSACLEGLSMGISAIKRA